MKTWIFFDTETTGLVGKLLLPLRKQPFVIEFAALKMRQISKTEWQEVDRLEFLCHPGFDIVQETTNITGITREMLAGKPPFSAFADSIVSFFEDADVRCGHNLTFDEEMLTNEFRRLGRIWCKKKQRRVCTVEQTEYLFSRRATLTEVYEKYVQKPHAGAHRAMVDVEHTAELVQVLVEEGLLE